MDWTTHNLSFLSACLDQVRLALAREASADGPTEPEPLRWPDWELEQPPALVELVERLELDPFSAGVLLLCVGMELDAGFPGFAASIHDDPACGWPSFALAMRVLPEAHWTALAPDAPLRRHHLVDVAPGPSLTRARLSCPERVWQHLLGIDGLDELLLRTVQRLEDPVELVPSHAEVARGLCDTILCASDLPVFQLVGRSPRDGHRIAHAACRELGVPLFRLAADLLPQPGPELDAMIRRWQREWHLGGVSLLVDTHRPGAAAAWEASLERVVEGFPGPVFVATRHRRPSTDRDAVIVRVEPPIFDEQAVLWFDALSSWPAELQPSEGGWQERAAARVVAEFRLDHSELSGAATQAAGSLAAQLDRVGVEVTPDVHEALAAAALWEACKAQTSPHIGHLADRLDRQVELGDLVVDEPVRALLEQVTLHVRHRHLVHRDWGFGGRGHGVTVLLAGPPGTGKTMAAEALASQLDLDLYRVDLGSVVSKYIGETEKNLGRIFDAAERGGMALLFDEADSLFGKRSEVKDSRDRYANMEVSFLLQRIERFGGLSILTTNLKDGLDHAFKRRIRFFVDLTFPDPALRARIWERTLGEPAPLEDIDPDKLARLNVAGGGIRNIALNAAFLAAADDVEGPITMGHLRAAAVTEYKKAGQRLSEREVGDWE